MRKKIKPIIKVNLTNQQPNQTPNQARNQQGAIRTKRAPQEEPKRHQTKPSKQQTTPAANRTSTKQTKSNQTKPDGWSVDVFGLVCDGLLVFRLVGFVFIVVGWGFL